VVHILLQRVGSFSSSKARSSKCQRRWEVKSNLRFGTKASPVGPVRLADPTPGAGCFATSPILLLLFTIHSTAARHTASQPRRDRARCICMTSNALFFESSNGSRVPVYTFRLAFLSGQAGRPQQLYPAKCKRSSSDRHKPGLKR
jgi:hypothetical protein